MYSIDIFVFTLEFCLFHVIFSMKMKIQRIQCVSLAWLKRPLMFIFWTITENDTSRPNVFISHRSMKCISVG